MSFSRATGQRSICVLGMHRSGTSTAARAINLLGAYLGRPEDLGQANEDNPEGYWERNDVGRLQNRVLEQLGNRWDATTPLPAQWHTSPAAETFRGDLKQLVSTHFGSCPLWGWKDPRSCLLLRVWRQVLEELGVALSVVFVVRHPVDVANSLARRDGMPVRQGLELWFRYNVDALESAQGLPLVFLSYDRLLAAWEPELRRCAAALALPWPADEAGLRAQMGTFIRPKLRHSLSTAEELSGAPLVVRELHDLLSKALAEGEPPPNFWPSIQRLANEFRTVPGFFDAGWDAGRMPQPPRPPYLQRTWWRWKRSLHKRLRAWKAQGT